MIFSTVSPVKAILELWQNIVNHTNDLLIAKTFWLNWDSLLKSYLGNLFSPFPEELVPGQWHRMKDSSCLTNTQKYCCCHSFFHFPSSSLTNLFKKEFHIRHVKWWWFHLLQIAFPGNNSPTITGWVPTESQKRPLSWGPTTPNSDHGTPAL